MTRDEHGQPRLAGPLSTAISISLFALLLLAGANRYFMLPGQPMFWDMAVYVRGIRAFLAGGDPYTHYAVLLFVYPPLFLKVAAALSHVIHGEAARWVYLLLNAVAIFAIPIVLAKEYLRERWMTVSIAVAIFAFHPTMTGAGAFFAANLSNQIYALLLLTAAWGLRKSRWEAFYMVLVVGGTLKFPLLAFLLLPLLLGVRQEIPSVITVALVAIVNLAQRNLYPQIYRTYTETIHYAIIDRRDVGYGLFSVIFRIGRQSHTMPLMLPYVTHIGIFGTVVVVLFLLRQRGWPGMNPALQRAAIILAAIQCNPRLLSYDFDIAVVPAAFLVVELTRILLAKGTLKWMLLTAALIFVASFMVSGANTLALLIFACEGVVLWLSWTASSGIEAGSAEQIA